MRLRRRRTYTSKDVRQMPPKRKPFERAGQRDRMTKRTVRKSSR
jgi:hypothetical protein